MKTILKLILLILCYGPGSLIAEPFINLEKNKVNYDLSSSLYLMEDPSGKLEITEISGEKYKNSFAINKSKYPSAGMSLSTNWGKFQWRNETSSIRQWYLVFEQSSLEYVTLYIPDQAGKYKILKHSPDMAFHERYIQNRKVIFPLDTPDKPQTIYFSVRSESAKELPVSLVSPEELARKNYIEMFFSGIYYGIIIIMFLYNLFIFLSIRDISYFYYVFFILCFGLIQACLDGFFYEFISPGNYLFARDARVFLASFSMTGVLLFGYSYLNIKRYYPALRKIYFGMLPLVNIPIVLYLTSGFYHGAVTVRLLMMLVAVVQIAVGAVMIFRNDSAKFYFIAWCFFLSGAIVFSLRGAGLFYIPYLSDYGMQWGNAIEVTILSFGLAHRIRTLQKEKEHISSIFGKVVDPVIRDHLLSGEIEVGGQERTGTILFGDIRNFTSLSEKYAPKDVVNQLNQYFESMSTEISLRNGLVNKYIGDGILALFNVPMTKPGHCDDAIDSAIGMKNRLKMLNIEFVKRGIPPLKMGIGIHTGSILAGNIGSSIRMEYTVIGDNVNIASRIESLTKIYKTPLLVTRDVIESLGNQNKYHIRDIDCLYLKGKSKAVSIIEVLNIDEKEKLDKKLNMGSRFQQARKLYINQEFEEAEKEFTSMYREFPEDNVLRVWALRCRKLKNTPIIKENWNGIVSPGF